MVWHLNKPDHQVFTRNPLIATVVELRFHPILKISSGHGISEFQGLLREKFPLYEEVNNQVFKIDLPGSVEVRQEKQYQLKSEDEGTVITLGGTSLIIETRNHENHKKTLDDVDVAFAALCETYAPVKPIRLGMRYINVVDRVRISNDLGMTGVCEWGELVAEDYLRMPAGIADLSLTKYSMEINSPIDGTGELSLKYGLQPKADMEEPVFRFDIDRFVEDGFEPENTRDLLDAFAHDIFTLYMSMVGESLSAWMEPTISAKV